MAHWALYISQMRALFIKWDLKWIYMFVKITTKFIRKVIVSKLPCSEWKLCFQNSNFYLRHSILSTGIKHFLVLKRQACSINFWEYDCPIILRITVGWHLIMLSSKHDVNQEDPDSWACNSYDHTTAFQGDSLHMFLACSRVPLWGLCTFTLRFLFKGWD